MEEMTTDPIRAAIREIVLDEIAKSGRDRGPRLLTLREAGITRRMLSRLEPRGLVVVKLGRDLRVEASSFERLVAESIVQPRVPTSRPTENPTLDAIDPAIRGAFMRAVSGEHG